MVSYQKLSKITKKSEGGHINMGRKSKIETSPHYNEIVDMLVAGYSGRHVSEHLSNQYNEKISYVALNNFKKKKLNVKAAVREKIIEEEKKKSQEKAIGEKAKQEIQAQDSFEIATDYRFKDIKKLDKLIQDSENVNIDLDNIHVDSEKYDPYREIDLKLKLKRLGLDALKAKYEMLDEDELDVNINDNRPVTSWDSLEQSRQKYLKEKKENK